MADVIYDPDKLTKPFSFLKTREDYFDHYWSLFIGLYEYRKARRGAAVKAPKLPFFREIGCTTPLAGNEVRHSPPYKNWGGAVYRLAKLAMLPYKTRPNWKIALDPTLVKKFKLSEFRCRPLVKLYPFGVVAYQVQIRMKSKKGIVLDDFIDLMKAINRDHVLLAKKSKYSVRGLASAFHTRILRDILREEDEEHMDIPVQVHRIITMNETNPKLDPATNQRELAAIVAMEQNWHQLSESFVQKHQGRVFEVKYNDQFFIFHPECTLIYPARFARKPKYEAYVRTCLRNNFASVLEFAMIENVLASDLSSKLPQVSAISDYSFEQIQKLKEMIARLQDRLKPFDPHWSQYWGNHLGGIHKRLFSTASSFPSWQSSTKRLLSKLNELRTMSLDFGELAAVREIAKSAHDASSTLDELQKKAEPFGIDSASIETLAVAARKIEEGLTNSVKGLNEINARAGTMNQLQTDELNKVAYRNTIMEEFHCYKTDFLPQYEDLVVSLVRQPTQPSGPSGEQATTASVKSVSDLAEAKNLVGEALKAKSKLQQVYDSVATFYHDAKPYIAPLVLAAKFFLRAYGVPIP